MLSCHAILKHALTKRLQGSRVVSFENKRLAFQNGVLFRAQLKKPTERLTPKQVSKNSDYRFKNICEHFARTVRKHEKCMLGNVITSGLCGVELQKCKAEHSPRPGVGMCTWVSLTSADTTFDRSSGRAALTCLRRRLFFT